MVRRKIMAMIIVFITVVTSIPSWNTNKVSAAMDIRDLVTINAGERVALTTQGSSLYQITNFIIESDSAVIGEMTIYNPDGILVGKQEKIFGSGIYKSLDQYEGGYKICIDVYFGQMLVRYNTANTIAPVVQKTTNDNEIKAILNVSDEIYIQPNEIVPLSVESSSKRYSMKLVQTKKDNSEIIQIDDNYNIVPTGSEGSTSLTLIIQITDTQENVYIQFNKNIEVNVVPYEVDPQSGLKFYYSEDEIEPGDEFIISADDIYGGINGKKYEGNIKWKVEDASVLNKTEQYVGVCSAKFKALRVGTTKLTLYLDGIESRSETINIQISVKTLINKYSDNLFDSEAMRVLDGAKDSCWETINSYSGKDRILVSLMTVAKKGFVSGTVTEILNSLSPEFGNGVSEDALEQSIDNLLEEYISNISNEDDKNMAECVEKIKKKIKLCKSVYSSSAGNKEEMIKFFAQNTGCDATELKGLYDKIGTCSKYASDAAKQMDFFCAMILFSQYQLEVLNALMINADMAAGTESYLYKGLSRRYSQINNIELYISDHFISDVLDEKINNALDELITQTISYLHNGNISGSFGTTRKVMEAVGYLASAVYKKNGGAFADDFILACIDVGNVGTARKILLSSLNEEELRSNYEFYVATVRCAVNSAIKISTATYISEKYSTRNALKFQLEKWLEEINEKCSYKQFLSEVRASLSRQYAVETNESGGVSIGNVTTQNVENIVSSLPNEKKALSLPTSIDGQSVTEILNNGFNDNVEITEITLPNTIKSIGKSAFQNCKSLTYIVLGNNAVSIGNSAFKSCDSLSVIGNSVNITSIESGAFENCNNLTKIELGDGLSDIAGNAFKGCSGLRTVTIRSNDVDIADTAFDGCPSDLTLYGYRNSNVEKYAKNNNFNFVPLYENVKGLYIEKNADILSVMQNGNVDTSGLKLKVVYEDGTVNEITDGWLVSCDTSKLGKTTVFVCYENSYVTYDVNVIENDNLKYKIDGEKSILTGSMSTYKLVTDDDKELKVATKWKSSDEEVLRIDSYGNAVGIKQGKVILTAVINDKVNVNYDVEITNQINMIGHHNYSNENYNGYIVYTPEYSGLYDFYCVKSGSSGNFARVYNESVILKASPESDSPFFIEIKLIKGQTYVLYVNSYDDIEVHITKAEKTVDSITLNSAPTRDYILGDLEYGEVGYKYSYSFVPSDMTGLSFTVNYSDGSSDEFTYKDIKEDGTLNGYPIYVCAKINVYGDVNIDSGVNSYSKFYYREKTCQFPVHISNVIKDIKIVNSTEKGKLYKGFESVCYGTEVCVEYVDNSESKITLSSDNVKYDVERGVFNINGYDGEVYGNTIYYLGKTISMSEQEASDAEVETICVTDLSDEKIGLSITYSDGVTKEIIGNNIGIRDFKMYAISNEGIFCYEVGKYEKPLYDIYTVTMCNKKNDYIDISVSKELVADENDGGISYEVVEGMELSIADTDIADVQKKGKETVYVSILAPGMTYVNLTYNGKSSIIPLQIIPDSPWINVVNNDDKSLRVEIWYVNEDVDGYELYRKKDTEWERLENVAITQYGSCEYIDNTIEYGVAYTYSACRIKNGLKSRIGEKTAIGVAIGTPKLEVIRNGNQITLSWNNIEEADGYVLNEKIITYSDYNESYNTYTYEKKDNNTVVLDYSELNTQGGVHYEYSLSAYKDISGVRYQSNSSNYNEYVAGKHSLEYIQYRKASCQSLGNYAYYICKDCGKLFKDYNGTIEMTQQEVTIPALGHDWVYSQTVEPTYTDEGYTLYICSRCDETKKSDYTDKLILKYPELTSASNTTSGIQLKWSKVSGATGYILYRKTGTGSWSRIADIKNGSTVSYIDKTAKSGTTYTYTIRAYSGKYMSYWKTTKTIKRLADPTVSSASNITAGVQVKWSKVAGATGYIVYRKTGKESWSRVADIKSGSTVSYTDKTAKSGTTYTYTVRAYSGSTMGDWSSTKTVKRLADPTVSSASNITAGVQVKWTKVTGATGYIIYRKTGTGSWSRLATIKSGSTTSYTDKSAKSGTNYSYTVRACNGSTMSDWHNYKTVKRLSNPAVTSASKTSNGINVKWSKVTGATGYVVYRKTAKGSWSRIANIKSGSTTSYSDTKASRGVTYTYTVRAYNGSTMSSFNSTKSAKR